MFYIKSKSLVDIKEDLEFITYFFKCQEENVETQLYHLQNEYEVIDEDILPNGNIFIETKNGKNEFYNLDNEWFAENVEDQRTVVYVTLMEKIFTENNKRKSDFIQLLGYKFVEINEVMIKFEGVCTLLDRWVVYIPIDCADINQATLQLVRINKDMLVEFMENTR